MSRQMSTRGPDGHGLWIDSERRIGMAHRRLAVVDLTNQAMQPFFSGDGHLTIVFNGEIYNYCELRSELKKHGAVFRTQSDTEVLLALYARDGSSMCRYLRGMYAFVIWDSRAGCLFMARDPFGIKPLYLHDYGGVVRFASQVKALLAGGGIVPGLSQSGLNGYQLWGSVPEPLTVFDTVKALPPGTWRQFRMDAAVEQGSFDSVDTMLSGNRPSPYKNLKEALVDSVKAHLVADVPVGVFLSAGIDSGAIAALSAECVQKSGQVLKTVTLGFEEFRGTANDETPVAEMLARRLSTDHSTVWLTRDDFETCLQEFFAAMDQPSIDGLNTWLVSRAASQAGLKVAMSGLGGDELFGGYPSFRQVPWMRYLARPFAGFPRVGRSIRRVCLPALKRFTSPKYAGLLEYGHHWGGAYLLRRGLEMPWDLPRDASFELPALPPSLNAVRHSNQAAVGYLETACYMRNQLLRDADWAGMAHSLEIRVPLVDAPLLRFVAGQRQRGCVFTKRDLAKCAEPGLPSNIARRPKTGFTVPLSKWADLENTHPRGLQGWQALVLDRYFDSCSLQRPSP